MEEKARLISLFEKLYHGHPWLDVNLADTLAKLTPAQAATKVGRANSIWEILIHLIEWRKNVLRRVNGEVVPSPDNNYFAPVKDQSANNWQATLAQLAETQRQWLVFLQQFDLPELNRLYPGNGMTYYEHIHGILQHDCYHLGQIALLARLAG
ncbi:MAG: DinB family protein [Bernardetiaceae bacterium]|jgi:uncharacterized damage-inducible protein DinB|nr:DinB family protein [Bernardetiaceae bacterium]